MQRGEIAVVQSRERKLNERDAGSGLGRAAIASSNPPGSFDEPPTYTRIPLRSSAGTASASIQLPLIESKNGAMSQYPCRHINRLELGKEEEMPNMDFPQVLDRVKGILFDPETEWGVIADEQTTIADLYRGYIVVLAAVPAIFGFLRVTVIGVDVPLIGTYRVSLFAGLAGTILAYALSLVEVYVLALIVNALAPTFGAQQDRLQAFKTSAYALTAFWVAGIGQLLPLLAVLIALAGAAYSVFLLYTGCRVRCAAAATRQWPTLPSA